MTDEQRVRAEQNRRYRQNARDELQRVRQSRGPYWKPPPIPEEFQSGGPKSDA